MRIHLVGVLGIGLLTLAGCNRESPKGGPGTASANKSTTTTTTHNKDNGESMTKSTETTKLDPDARRNTFTIKVSEHQNVTQGKNQEVNISLSRGADFKQNVKLSFKAPAGLKVDPSAATVKSDQDSAKVLIEATDTAAVGAQVITVTGTPETGDATSVDLHVDVKKK